MTDQPNILWYCTDQQRFDTIGALGNPHVKTPVIDALVREGVAFTHVYCQSPICTPSRSSLMTGLYPSRLHNTRNGNATFPEFPPLITRLIADAGYDGGLVGKFHLQSAGYRTEPRLDDGFRFWKFSHAPRDDWEEGHDYADWVRGRGGDLDGFLERDGCVPPEFHQTTWASEMAIEFIEQPRKTGSQTAARLQSDRGNGTPHLHSPGRHAEAANCGDCCGGFDRTSPIQPDPAGHVSPRLPYN